MTTATKPAAIVTLTIAAALKRISVLKGKARELAERSKASVSYLEGQRLPDFDYVQVEAQLFLTKEKLVTLQAAVAVANATKRVDLEGGDSMVLAEAIRRAEESKDEIARLKALPIREGEEPRVEDVWDDDLHRSKRITSKVVWQTKLTNVARHQRIEALETYLEALNNAITAANHLNKVEWREPVAVAA